MSAWVGNDQEHRLKKASLPTSFLPYHAILTENIYSQLEIIGKAFNCMYICTDDLFLRNKTEVGGIKSPASQLALEEQES